MTKNIKIFAFFSLILSVLFFLILNYSLANFNQRYISYSISVIIIILLYSFTGEYLAQKDNQRKVKTNLTLMYLITPAVINAIIGILWVIIFKRSLLSLYIYIMIIAACLIFYIIARKFFIKNINKRKIFD